MTVTAEITATMQWQYFTLITYCKWNDTCDDYHGDFRDNGLGEKKFDFSDNKY